MLRKLKKHISYKKDGIEKASVNLCAYAKTPIIPVGESATVTLSFNIFYFYFLFFRRIT